MEVVIPVRSPDFDFNSSIYAVAPPTPKLMGDYYFSAPTSPTRNPELDLDFDALLISENTNSLATVPFAWEEKPGVPKSFAKNENFAFDTSSDFNRNSSASAEDLFHGGMIKSVENESSNGRENRGREREAVSRLPSSRSRRTRSLPPIRGVEQPPTPKANCTTLTVSGSDKGSKKWSFLDLFLFRSASDGRALDNDPLKKYSAIFWKHDEDFRNSSMRSDRGSGSGSGSKRRGKVSAHELHYNVNRAVSNDMKKKTFLPYKQGILGRLAFNPTVNALANGFGFSHNN